MSYSEPDPTDLLLWAQTKRQATSQYGQGQANLAYQRTLADQSNQNQTYDQNRQWDQYRDRLPGGFAGRGLLNSGIYHGALQNYGVDRTTAMGRQAQAYQNALGQFD